MIIFIKHIDIEGPDTFGTFCDQQGIETQIVELQNGDSLPGDLNNIDAVVSLGGPMNVYEEDKHPFLKDEDRFIKQIVSKEIPFIGLCLGSQLLAKASGAQVGKSPEKEIGFFPVQLTGEGQRDPLFEGLQQNVDIFQWHEDMSGLPMGAELLASSQGCPHQAFKVGPCAYGIQFHVEVTEPTIRKWAEAYFSKGNSSQAQHAKIMSEDYHEKKKVFCQTADTIYNNFLKIINKHNNKSGAH